MITYATATERAKSEHITQARLAAKSLLKCLEDRILQKNADMLASLLKQIELHCREGGLIAN
ncbi:hypothetical protein ABIF65_008914 [Bradyrhizobium japonicum]|uniref:hypothetical protein n=1 Tax=Bradyrhizobium TaxID=374 RepID=UPI000421C875|nr:MULTISPECIES: hypothetical protein [Bradyrhizobium]MBR0884216.1 hypothetical protein [Bradyrhizobium liaoningense]MBR1004452.1 hypothetical protein [Bradyrhizobium liaoningense]MBR1070699.1 hypothetical protein [Bradyrhizobium liaoningense]MCP1746825.1 hypothetical protein [Bradyrhizobium japonicum]MCP1774463.1 hypothetical protein [Bradyrhizobium japonicum]